MNKRFFVLTITIASVLFLFQINLLAQPAALHPCKPSTNSPVLSPNATFTVLGVTGLANYYCLGDGISASVSYTNTSGTNTTTITYADCSTSNQLASCDASLDISNCTWTASVGSWSTSSNGISASFTPTDCGNGWVTFHVAWTNACDGTTGSDDRTGYFSVVQLTNQCVATIPTPRSRTTIGVGEEVVLTLQGGPSDTTWDLAGGGTLEFLASGGAAVKFTAPGTKSTCVITAILPDCSVACSPITFDVIQPSGLQFATYMKCYHTKDVVSAGFKASVTILPTSVSFIHIRVKEGGDVAATTWGWFDSNNPGHHIGDSEWDDWGSLNAYNVFTHDKCHGSAPGATASSGGWEWKNIPWYYIMENDAANDPNADAGHYISSVTQKFSFDSTSATMEKGAANATSKHTDDTLNCN